MSLSTKIIIACGILLAMFALSLASALAEVHFLATLGMGVFIFVAAWILFFLYALSHKTKKFFATK